MIQRIQSVYLLVGAVACGLPFLVGLPTLEAGTPPWVFTLRGVLYIAAGVLGFVAIFLYTSRERQQIAAFWAQVVAAIAVIVIIGMLLLYGRAGSAIQAVTANAEAIVSVAAPLFALGCFRSARSAIARDIKLVKSMDRLRD